MKGLYVHIPFCIKKCRYCDFNSFCFTDADKTEYLKALFSEMELHKGEKIDSVFIGGGTPTSLNSYEIGSLIDHIRNNFKLAEDVEFTIEANPGTVDSEKLKVMYKGGVNRLSVGIQSFDNAHLKNLGRIHTAMQGEETIRMARECGFDNISIDLMSAIHGQTTEELMESLNKAVKLGVEHISCYSLIIEPGTPFYDEYNSGCLNLPDEDTEREMYLLTCNFLENNGYRRYEISNFAKKGYESRHNKKYWQCKEYIGIGLSAHSYNNGARYANTGDFSKYIKNEYAESNIEVLTETDKMSEFMFMGLRMSEGVSETEFYKRFRITPDDVFSVPLTKFVNLGMIIRKEGRIYLSEQAVNVSNSIMCEFIL